MPLPADAHLPDETGRIVTDPERFCTGHALAAGEPLAGWGAHQARNILIRWPKGRWEHSLRIAAGMPDELIAAINAAVEARWRINLIDRKSDQNTCVLLYPQALQFTVEPSDLPALIRAIIDEGDLTSFASQPTTRKTILVCTHGKHDACCAKWGFAAYKAIAEKAADHEGVFDVWEATHLGGCRFAGGALVLPAGRKYGRLVPADAMPLLQAEAQNLPYLPAFRGSSMREAPAQVAEIAALKHLPPGTLCHHVVEIAGSSPERTYRVETSQGNLLVRCDPGEISSYGACSDLKAKKPLKPKTIWTGHVLSIVPISKTESTSI
ncbi:sucrase ferredoxin [Cognatiyoonia sp. IB215446]|uniref:sucrase ferredoxin n=1 Tax=Cognatiyoonia sp. IB215446 TaxID=3097355 RepID=UPI002A167AD7|nr:sucrase ferredoxin [Cognatiyoonia sp. IB215446]MDX8350424.1 sucrase ferredoxin [Cognatiyoonia sp. IB215446]